MIAEVGKWGNSLAIRIPSREAEAWDIKAGDRIKVQLVAKVPRDKVDVSNAPFFRDPDPLASEHHDEYVAEALWEHLQEKFRRK